MRIFKVMNKRDTVCSKCKFMKKESVILVMLNNIVKKGLIKSVFRISITTIKKMIIVYFILSQKLPNFAKLSEFSN